MSISVFYFLFKPICLIILNPVSRGGKPNPILLRSPICTMFSPPISRTKLELQAIQLTQEKQRAEQEKQRAEKYLEMLRQRGIDPPP